MSEDPADAHLANRRDVLRAAAGTGVLVVGANASAGVASAQGDGGTGQTTKGAIPRDAPLFGNADYSGMFLHVTGVANETDATDVRTCPFAASDEEVVAYDAVLVDRLEEDARRGETTLYALGSNRAVTAGTLFVVNDQRTCGAGVVQVTLAEISDTSLPSPPTETPTSTPIPGFGAGATLASLLAAGGLLRRRATE